MINHTIRIDAIRGAVLISTPTADRLYVPRAASHKRLQAFLADHGYICTRHKDFQWLAVYSRLEGK